MTKNDKIKQNLELLLITCVNYKALDVIFLRRNKSSTSFKSRFCKPRHSYPTKNSNLSYIKHMDILRMCKCIIFLRGT